MENVQHIKEQFIKSAIVNSEALAEGDHKTANKHAKVLRKILEKIENGSVDKNILVELLQHPHLSVIILAAIDLLRIKYEVKQAEETLERIASKDEAVMKTEEKLGILAAKTQLECWKEKGCVYR